MFLSKRIFRAFAALAIAALAACAGSGGSAPAARSDATHALAKSDGSAASLLAHADLRPRALRPSWLDRAEFDRVQMTSTSALPHYLLYVSNTSGNSVDIYKSNEYEPQHQNQPMLGSISVQYPAGLFVDSFKNLWVVSFAGYIYEFTPASMPNPALTLTDPYAPEGVAVDSNGQVYVANNAPDANNVVGVAVFAKGATTPYKTLTDPRFKYALYPYVDKNQNVYVSYYDGQDNYEGVFPRGSSTFVPFNLANSAYQGKVDRAGDLLAIDHHTGLLEIYPNGSAAPSSSISLGSADYGFFDVIYGQDQVFTITGYANNGSPVSQFTFPAGVKDNTISGASTYDFGIVTSPAAPYPPPYLPSSTST